MVIEFADVEEDVNDLLLVKNVEFIPKESFEGSAQSRIALDSLVPWCWYILSPLTHFHSVQLHVYFVQKA